MNSHIMLVTSAVSDLTSAHPHIREAMHSLEDGEHIFTAAVKACHKLERSTALISVVGDIRNKFEGLSTSNLKLEFQNHQILISQESISKEIN